MQVDTPPVGPGQRVRREIGFELAHERPGSVGRALKELDDPVQRRAPADPYRCTCPIDRDRCICRRLIHRSRAAHMRLGDPPEDPVLVGRAPQQRRRAVCVGRCERADDGEVAVDADLRCRADAQKQLGRSAVEALGEREFMVEAIRCAVAIAVDVGAAAPALAGQDLARIVRAVIRAQAERDIHRMEVDRIDGTIERDFEPSGERVLAARHELRQMHPAVCVGEALSDIQGPPLDAGPAFAVKGGLRRGELEICPVREEDRSRCRSTRASATDHIAVTRRHGRRALVGMPGPELGAERAARLEVAVVEQRRADHDVEVAHELDPQGWIRDARVHAVDGDGRAEHLGRNGVDLDGGVVGVGGGGGGGEERERAESVEHHRLGPLGVLSRRAAA